MKRSLKPLLAHFANRQNDQFFRRIGAFLLFAVILIHTCLPVQAAQTTTLRIAYYPLDGFFEYNELGEEVGYGVELLNKVSQYTGIHFEYVKADSWEETKQMLLDGEADLRMPATMPTIPSTALSYNAFSILDTYNVMLTRSDREDLFYQDYDRIRTLKIAVTENFYKVNTVKNYLDTIGVTDDQLVFCREYNECRDRLNSGEVDALISNIMDMDSSMKMLARFNSISNYFSMTLNNPMLDTLDNAMSQIKLDEPLFLANLYAKWFPERTTVPLTLEESEYLSAVDTLTFAFQPNEGYLSRYEDGTYYGIYTEIAKYICEKLGVGYKAVSVQDCLDDKEKTDIYAGFFYDQNYAEECNFSLSAPLNDINYYIIQKKETQVEEEHSTIAAIKKFRYTLDYLEVHFSSSDFVYCNTYEECLEAVESGKADMAVINNYIAEYYLGMYQFSDLTARLSTDYSHLFCFAAEDQNEILASILTKTISGISDEEMNQLYIMGQEQKPESHYLQAVMYQNPIQFTLGIAGILALLLVIIMLVIFARRSKKQNIKLEKALSAKSSFLARMSHDMRTPMNGILGLSYLMEEQKDLASVKRYIPQLQESGEYLLQLINDVLDVNKIESGNISLQPRVCDEKKLFDSVIRMMEPLITAKHLDFHFEKKNIEWKYMVLDEQRVKQIFVNLLSNAVKFTPEGGRIDFEMELVSQTDHMIRDKFVVRDNGIGMSREFLPHLFEPFRQEERLDIDTSNGSGLGLSIVKKLVELMDGTITVESEENKGTEITVLINFPLAEEPETEQAASEQAVSEDAETGQCQEVGETEGHRILEGRHFLLCEDHPLNAKIAIQMLEKQGAVVSWAENGKIGVDIFTESEQGFFDAILMDIRMPVMDGLTCARTIRSLDREDAKRIPMIAMTANAYEEDMKKSLDAGMNTHLAKPIEPEKFYATLTTYLNIRTEDL